MVSGFKPLELSAGVDAALKRLASICARDGYELRVANVRMVDTTNGAEIDAAFADGAWYEVQEVD